MYYLNLYSNRLKNNKINKNIKYIEDTLKGVIKMSNLNLVIGSKLKKIRNERGLSLDDVSKLTHVSKAMLGQIERGSSNPTISTLWKISTGLKISFSFFVTEDKYNPNIIDQKYIDPILEDNGRMKLYPIFNFNPNTGFEVFSIELDSECNHCSTPHNSEVEEYIIVTKGVLELLLDNTCFKLQTGQSIKFKADIPHSYINNSKEKTIFQNIIYYKK